jgi:pullulanase
VGDADARAGLRVWLRELLFVNRKEEIYFFLRLEDHPDLVAAPETMVYLAGDFNGWDAVGRLDWQLRPDSLDGEPVLLWTGRAAPFFANPWPRFKFVTQQHRWIDVPADAPNAQADDLGNRNRVVDPERTGQHLFSFTLAAPLALSESWRISWADGSAEGQSVPLMPGEFFFHRAALGPLGARVIDHHTHFRLFAPRARSVELCVSDDVKDADRLSRYPLTRREDGTWDILLDQDLHGWFYWYHIDGPQDAFGLFAPERAVLDPYALATVSREGPGIVLAEAWIGEASDGFRTPAWHDLVIVEAHVRDLAEKAPVRADARERRGFAGLAAWVRSPEFYLHALGVNCVELQPVQEFDSRTPEEYHWGYMTANFFAPASGYSTVPEEASGVHELQEVVAAFHERGMAVLLDVVFNHVGEPAHLMFIDKLYYFEQDASGQLANWSGCGNDLRAGAAMSKRLIIDSCTHLIRAYGVDGFRFDLAELLGVEVLKEIEVALKAVKPDLILIAEPWSFRGHIAAGLRDTGWASWNDGYRDFVRTFVRGGGSRGSYEYFLKGSPWHFAKWPAQTVNYTESHDDRVWIDVITENHNFDGFQPTANDRRRTHLMVAMLMMSIGIPMLAAGQDFLRSKRGVNNTYQRGDLNALDYFRLFRYPSTHAYFADWVTFRRSVGGVLLRHFSRASEGFFQFWFAPESNAAATLYNADLSQGTTRLLFALNPTLADVTLELGPAALTGAPWRAVADAERFYHSETKGIAPKVETSIALPALSCMLWVSAGPAV